MSESNWGLRGRGPAAVAAVAMAVVGLGASRALADEPIVGFWQATWTDASDGHLVSYVWDIWHSDRTETQNDSGNTLDGNVCSGAWVPLGQRTYGLTHPAFSHFCPSCGRSFPEPEEKEGQFIDIYSCNILERITVDKSSNNYAGPGVLKCVLGVDPLDPSAQVIFTENLKITAKRVTVDVNQLPPG